MHMQKGGAEKAGRNRVQAADYTKTDMGGVRAGCKICLLAKVESHGGRGAARAAATGGGSTAAKGLGGLRPLKAGRGSSGGTVTVHSFQGVGQGRVRGKTGQGVKGMAGWRGHAFEMLAKSWLLASSCRGAGGTLAVPRCCIFIALNAAAELSLLSWLAGWLAAVGLGGSGCGCCLGDCLGGAVADHRCLCLCIVGAGGLLEGC